MKMSVILLVVLLSSVVYPQSKQSHTPDSSVVLSGEDYAFAITVPLGWILESGEGTWSGSRAILYPQGVPRSPIMWGNPDAWITIGIASKRAEGRQTLKNLLAYFAKIDSQWMPTPTILYGPNLVTKDKKPAIMKQVKGDRYAATAFIDDESIVTVIQLFRFSEEDFSVGFPRFKQLVESYRSVAVDKKPAK